MKAGQASQGELSQVERQERDRLSTLVRARANERQQVLHERFPHLPYRFLAPIGEVAARPRIDDLATHAGALTYGSFLAIPPLLLFASSVVGFVLAGHPEAAQKAVQELVSLVPGLGSLVTERVQATINGRVTLGVVGVLGLLWSASGFASRLRHALGVIFRTEWVGLLTGRIRGTVIGVLMVAAFVALSLFTGLEARLQATHRTTIASLFQAAAFAFGGFAFPDYLPPAHAREGPKTPGPPPRRCDFQNRMASADGPRGTRIHAADPELDRAVRNDRRDLRPARVPVRNDVVIADRGRTVCRAGEPAPKLTRAKNLQDGTVPSRPDLRALPSVDNPMELRQ
jgi:hypothetical protein